MKKCKNKRYLIVKNVEFNPFLKINKITLKRKNIVNKDHDQNRNYTIPVPGLFLFRNLAFLYKFLFPSQVKGIYITFSAENTLSSPFLIG